MAKALTKTDELKQTIDHMKTQFKLALPEHVSVDRFVRIIQSAIMTTRGLVECDRTSLLSACMKAAACGLVPDGVESVIIPYKGKAQFIQMVGGVLKLVRNSGELATITSQMVHEKDDFKYFVDMNGEHINFNPDMFGERGKAIGVFALAKTKDGDFYFEIMTMAQINHVRKSSPSGDNGPWGSHPEEMMRKTVIKRLAKRLPKSTDIDGMLKDDDTIKEVKKVKDQNQQEFIDVAHTNSDDEDQAQIGETSTTDTHKSQSEPIPKPVQMSPLEPRYEEPQPIEETLQPEPPKKRRMDQFLEGKNQGV